VYSIVPQLLRYPVPPIKEVKWIYFVYNEIPNLKLQEEMYVMYLIFPNGCMKVKYWDLAKNMSVFFQRWRESWVRSNVSTAACRSSGCKMPASYPLRPGFEPGSFRVGFTVDKAALGQVFSYYFGFPCQALYRLFHTHHHPSSVSGKIGQ
jgi:hypothetical protein